MVAQNEQKILQEIDKFMDEVGDKIFAKSQENLIKDGKVDTSNLLRSGQINRFFLKKQIIYQAPHAVPIEYGRVAGTFPPLAPLQKWVKRKLGVSNEKEAKSIAYAIALQIKKRGIKESPYLRPAVESVVSETGLVDPKTLRG